MKIILALLFFLLFIPIPIKLHFSYTDKNAVFKIYNKKLNLSKGNNLKRQSESADKSEVKNNIKNNKVLYMSVLKDYLKKLNRTNFKPLLILNFSLIYSTNNAAVTSLLYPLINEFLSLVCTLLKIPCRLKLKTISIQPKYEDKINADLVINCIFIVNLAKLTYMIILLLISYLGGLRNGKSSNRKFNEINYGKS